MVFSIGIPSHGRPLCHQLRHRSELQQFLPTGCEASWDYYNGNTSDYVLRTSYWNVAYRNWDNAYYEPQYASVYLGLTAGYRYTIDSISFYIKQTSYVDWYLESNQSGYGLPTAGNYLTCAGGGLYGIGWTKYTQTLTGDASFANLTSGTEFRWYGVANSENSAGCLYFDDIAIDGDTQARASLATGLTAAASRVIQNTASVRAALTIKNDALTAGTTTTETLNWTAATLSGATGVSLSSTSGTGLASGSTSTIYANVDTSTTGLKSGTVRITGSNAWRTNSTIGTYVDYALAGTAVVAKRTVTGDTIALGRQMSGINLSTLLSKTVTLRSTGDSNNYTSVSVGGNSFNSTETFDKTGVTASGIIAATGTWASYAVTAEGLTNEGTYSNVNAGYTATLLSKRAVTADTLALGRQMSGINLSALLSKTVTLRSTGVDGSYTRIGVATNLFDTTEDYGTTATGSGTIAASGIFKSYAVTSENLTGEGTYSNVDAGYTATLLSKRTVNADTIALGRQMSGIDLSALLSKTVTLHSTGVDGSYTRIGVATNLFDTTEDYSTTATGSGTIAASGIFKSYAVTSENLTGEGTYSNVTAGYTATLLSKRTVNADTIALGRQMSGINLSALLSKNVTLHSTGVDGSYTRINVATNLFDSTEDYSATATGSGTIAAIGIFKSYAVTSENLTGEGTYSNVDAGYTATILSKRTVTGDTVILGGKYLSGAALHNLGTQDVTLRSIGADNSYTRVIAGGNVFDSAESFTVATTGSGVIGHSGNFAAYTITGESLTGEGTYSDINVGYTAEVVGNATADTSGSQSVFGDALTANLAAAASLAGLSSWTTADSETIGSIAEILAGTYSGGEAGTVSMAWRTRADDETTDLNLLLADVVDVNTGTGTINPFVLQMNYSPTLLITGSGLTEQMLASQGSIYLAWLNTSNQWVNAIDGNIGTNVGVSNFQGSWQDAGSTLALGTWGVNVADHTVWAVVDHNSQFSVANSAVPEPGTILAALSILGPAGLIFRRRKSA